MATKPPVVLCVAVPALLMALLVVRLPEVVEGSGRRVTSVFSTCTLLRLPLVYGEGGDPDQLPLPAPPKWLSVVKFVYVV